MKTGRAALASAVVLGALGAAGLAMLRGVPSGATPVSALGAPAPGNALGQGAPTAAGGSPWVGTAACGTCHPGELAAYRGSHHERALTEPPTGMKVGGADGGGSGNAPAEAQAYAVKYVAGVFPLQEYVVETERGHLQTFALAWDARPRVEGGQRWFDVYEGSPHAGPRAPRDPLHWTRASQNWNHVCADCHSTGVRRQYDVETDTFATTWAELTVGCEGCHGPGRDHVAWAKQGGAAPSQGAEGKVRASQGLENKGLRVGLRRSAAWAPTRETGSPAPRPRDDAELETCAPCHSRRETLHEGTGPGDRFFDGYEPELLRPGRYEVDGQVQGEVYEWGSFVQSRMFHAGVRCSDCHEPHGATLRAPGNALCTRCHDGARFDGPRHHHHAGAPPKPEPTCAQCHMPEHVFMGIDGRRDHSLRVPRPDLSERFGTPNACNACHKDRSSRWAAAAALAWYGRGITERPSFAEALARGRGGDADAAPLLARVANDNTLPALARASALELLGRHPTAEGLRALASGAREGDALVAYGAALGLAPYPMEARVRLLGPLLSAPPRLLRVAAAKALADAPAADLPPSLARALAQALTEVEESLALAASRPESHLERGALALRRGRPDEAEAAFRTALRLDEGLVAARINLAEVHRSRGHEDEAERELREALRLAPGDAPTHHALGLLLLRKKRPADALPELEAAARLGPERARFAYVYALALKSLGEGGRAAAVLKDAQRRHPFDSDLKDALGPSPMDAERSPARVR